MQNLPHTINMYPTLKNLTNTTYGRPQETQNSILQSLGSPHISSFNHMVDKGLDDAVKNLTPVQFALPSGERVYIRITDASLSCPLVPQSTIGVKDRRIWPLECRQRAGTYKGTLNVNIEVRVDNTTLSVTRELGDIPIMIKSNRCHLANLTGKQLVEKGEHEEEWGGYFIIKGHEKLLRMLLLTRRNYPVAVKRNTWKMRGVHFSDLGVLIRCVAEDHTSANNVMHFVTDGTVRLMLTWNKQLYYTPLMLIMKALCNYKDQYIYKRLIEGYEDNLYYTSCMQNMLRAMHDEGLHTPDDCKNYIGKMFRIRLYDCPEWYTDIQVAEHTLQKSLLIHLNNPADKFSLLVFMTQKLFAMVEDKCKIEGVDAVMMQEVLLGGHLYLQVLKDRMQSFLTGLRFNIQKRATSNMGFSLTHTELASVLRVGGTVEHALEHFLSTGNISSTSGLSLQQDKGLAIIAENINRMRYMSHFRSVHRGTFFQEMRTTEARQLLPDAWGFICPVHTPDGAPCGLLNHLTLNCFLTDTPDAQKVREIPRVLAELGMIPVGNFFEQKIKMNTHYVVQLDGKVLGYCERSSAEGLVQRLRLLKIQGVKIPNTLEIALIPIKEVPGQYPGLFLFTGSARMMRPLINLVVNQIEFIGTLEQVYLDICVTQHEAYKGVTTHMEVSKTGFLSNLAQLIPMPDCNQSPRNMYQCQMGKQTMGTPCHTWKTQAETKLYRLQTPATPLFRPMHYDMLQLDDYAMGTNAIVAVISYTGYDMEDAMIISKSAYERGFAHGSIYKTQFIQLDNAEAYFCRDPSDSTLANFIDTDGLPFIGRLMKNDEPLYCYYDPEESKFRTIKVSSKELHYVDKVAFCGNFAAKCKKTACITYRIPRNPSVGDKFASRAGQKGICSQKWPVEDLPFTETGLVPDILFNPHGFPSRMTIAMMIELMAGKSASLHGLVHDASPFKFNESNTAIDYFGRLLEAGGYNYYGTETMYSGIDGREMTCQIFFGVVHYQRLRHMVSDKWQVRSTGAMDMITKQPVGGRKRGGGVRFGEMERDSLISHGVSFVLQDRLLNCSDKATAFICTSCGSLLSPVTVITRKNDKRHLNETKEMCRLCDSNDTIAEIEIPYIFKFLVTQLASVNINVKINSKHV